MLNRGLFFDLCRRIEQEQDPVRLHEFGQQMMELVKDEELALLAKERANVQARFNLTDTAPSDESASESQSYVCKLEYLSFGEQSR